MPFGQHQDTCLGADQKARGLWERDWPDSGYVCVEFPRAAVAVSHVIEDKGSGVENETKILGLPVLRRMRGLVYINLVPRAFSLAWGWGAPPPSQGKGPGNEVGFTWRLMASRDKVDEDTFHKGIYTHWKN